MRGGDSNKIKNLESKQLNRNYQQDRESQNLSQQRGKRGKRGRRDVFMTWNLKKPQESDTRLITKK